MAGAGAVLLTVVAGCSTAAPSWPPSETAAPAATEADPTVLRPDRPKPPADAADNMAPNILAWDAVSKLARASVGQTNVPFSFSLTNVCVEPVVIYATETTCDCAVAQLPANPWIISPGEYGEIQATVDLRGKSGVATNWVVIFTSKGNRLLEMRTVAPTAVKPG